MDEHANERELMAKITDALQAARIPVNTDSAKALMMLGGLQAGLLFDSKRILDGFTSEQQAVESLINLYGITAMAGMLMSKKLPGWEEKTLEYGERILKGSAAFPQRGASSGPSYSEDDF